MCDLRSSGLVLCSSSVVSKQAYTPILQHITEMFHLSYIIKEKKPRSSENMPTVSEKSIRVIDDFFFRPRAHFCRRTFFLHYDRVTSVRGGGYEWEGDWEVTTHSSHTRS